MSGQPSFNDFLSHLKTDVNGGVVIPPQHGRLLKDVGLATIEMADDGGILIDAKTSQRIREWLREEEAKGESK